MTRTRKAMIGALASAVIAVTAFVNFSYATPDQPSVCLGTSKKGALRGGWQLPLSGANFRAYSTEGWALGRTYVHSAVHSVVLNAYSALALSLPSRVYVYGETGFAHGGEFTPHRTHQNGLSVDFMVPVVDSAGNPTELPRSMANRFGYDIEFDRRGKADALTIDFEALAVHLLALDESARANGVRIARVIFAPDLQAHLHGTAAWPKIRLLPFSTRPSWVRHDDHYHVDFDVHCEGLESARD